MVLLAHFELATIFFCAMFCRGVAIGKTGETMVGLTKITSNVTNISIKMMAEGTVRQGGQFWVKYFAAFNPNFRQLWAQISGGGADYAHHIGFVPPKIILLLRPCFRWNCSRLKSKWVVQFFLSIMGWNPFWISNIIPVKYQKVLTLVCYWKETSINFLIVILYNFVDRDCKFIFK